MVIKILDKQFESSHIGMLLRSYYGDPRVVYDKPTPNRLRVFMAHSVSYSKNSGRNNDYSRWVQAEYTRFMLYSEGGTK